MLSCVTHLHAYQNQGVNSIESQQNFQQTIQQSFYISVGHPVVLKTLLLKSLLGFNSIELSPSSPFRNAEIPFQKAFVPRLPPSAVVHASPPLPLFGAFATRELAFPSAPFRVSA